MINSLNPLNELSDIYLGNISEEDNSPEAVKGRVMQYVRAIRYRARKENDTLSKAYNDFMAGQGGVSGTEKQMVKERLGLTGGGGSQSEEVEHVERVKESVEGDFEAEKTRRKARIKGEGDPDQENPMRPAQIRGHDQEPTAANLAAERRRRELKKHPGINPIKKEGFSDWRNDLREIADGIAVTSKKAGEKIVDKDIKNKITINPVMGQAESVAATLGGELLEMYEIKEDGDEQQLQQLQRKQLQLDLRKLKMRRKAMATNKTSNLDAEQKEKENSVATEEVILEKDTEKEVAAVIDYYRSKKGSTSESVEADEYLATVTKVKKAELEADIKRWDSDSLQLEDADGNVAFEVIDVIKAPKLTELGEDLASVKATTYGLPHRERAAAIEKYKKEQRKKKSTSKKEASKSARETVPATGALKKYDKDGNKRVRVIDAGYEPEGELIEKDLNASERRALPNKDFALPGKGKGPEGKQAGSYPIPDEKHARSALSLVSQHGTPAEKVKVRAKVKAKYPAIFQGIKNAVKEDAAFNKVAGDLKKKYRSGVLVGKEKPPAPTEAEKKEYEAQQAKIASQDTRDDLEKSSHGRYSRKYSNRGSD